MYELENGSKRLAGAIERRAEDEDFIRKLSDLLNYLPDQLKEDIQALNDKVNQ